MVKLTGPCLSTEAHGKLANAVAFTTSKRGTSLKKHQAPKQPNTGKQLSARAIIKWLSENWKLLSDPQKATWTARAQHLHVARYHAFIAYNADRWNNFLAPSKEYPATETPPGPNSPTFQLLPRIKMARLRIGIPTGSIPWGLAVQRSTSPIGIPTHDTTVHFMLQDAASVVFWFDTPLATGTYYYKVQPFTETGLKGTGSPVRTVVIA